MKRALYIILLALSVSMLHAQSGVKKGNLLTYLQKAMNFNKVVPQEKVYLHFDNVGYFENETLWFKAYVVRTDIGRATDLSKVLYVELLNPTGDVVKLRKYPIDSLGVAHGDMKLDTLLSRPSAEGYMLIVTRTIAPAMIRFIRRRLTRVSIPII